jgi:hypothetical protein
MPRWQRWLCAGLLIAFSPLLLTGLAALATALLLQTGANIFKTPARK